MFNNAYVLLKWWKTWRSVPVLNWIRAASLYRTGQFTQAEKFYLKGLESHFSHPANFCARLDLAYCQFRIGKIEDAEKQLKYVTSRMKGSKEGYLRLARLQLWCGRSLEAAWTLRRALRENLLDAEVVSLLIFSVLDHGGPNYILTEAKKALSELSVEARENSKLKAAEARLKIYEGDDVQGRAELEALSLDIEAPFETILLYAESLLEEGKISHARMELRRAMVLEPNHPRVLSLLAEAYLRSGPFYSPEYACQLATSACQNSAWLSAREMHVLAESYYHGGDNVSALIIAHKAKQAGSKLLGEYRHMRNLEKLIDGLGTTQSVWVKSKVL